MLPIESHHAPEAKRVQLERNAYFRAFFKDIAWQVWLMRIVRPLDGAVSSGESQRK